MALHVTDIVVIGLAEDLARRRGCTIADLLRDVLEKKLARTLMTDEARDTEVSAIQKRFRLAWKEGTSNHDFLYDCNGLPIL